jgi:hypothetical protein
VEFSNCIESNIFRKYISILRICPATFPGLKLIMINTDVSRGDVDAEPERAEIVPASGNMKITA